LRLLAVSPHLDDVALGCAGLVVRHPGAMVATVTAGRPGPHTLTHWDRRCGFGEGDDVVGVRRKEDRAALSILGASPVWLDFLDRQYAPVADPGEVALAVEHLLTETAPDVVAMPLGLSHPDHLMTAAACREVARRRNEVRWIVYEDAIYRPLVRERLAEGFELRDVEVPTVDPQRKRDAIACYATQVRGLGDLLVDAYEPERYWMLDTSR
jgi:LmbE family N-acetylglucosaminyl deacetylase